MTIFYEVAVRLIKIACTEAIAFSKKEDDSFITRLRSLTSPLRLNLDRNLDVAKSKREVLEKLLLEIVKLSPIDVHLELTTLQGFLTPYVEEATAIAKNKNLAGTTEVMLTKLRDSLIETSIKLQELSEKLKVSDITEEDVYSANFDKQNPMHLFYTAIGLYYAKKKFIEHGDAIGSAHSEPFLLEQENKVFDCYLDCSKKINQLKRLESHRTPSFKLLLDNVTRDKVENYLWRLKNEGVIEPKNYSYIEGAKEHYSAMLDTILVGILEECSLLQEQLNVSLSSFSEHALEESVKTTTAPSSPLSPPQVLMLLQNSIPTNEGNEEHVKSEERVPTPIPLTDNSKESQPLDSQTEISKDALLMHDSPLTSFDKKKSEPQPDFLWSFKKLGNKVDSPFTTFFKSGRKKLPPIPEDSISNQKK